MGQVLLEADRQYVVPLTTSAGIKHSLTIYPADSVSPINEVDENLWEIAKEKPIVQAWLDLGHIREITGDRAAALMDGKENPTQVKANDLQEDALAVSEAPISSREAKLPKEKRKTRARKKTTRVTKSKKMVSEDGSTLVDA